MRRKIQYLVTKDPKIMECVSDNTEWLESVKILNSNEKTIRGKTKPLGYPFHFCEDLISPVGSFLFSLILCDTVKNTSRISILVLLPSRWVPGIL